MKPLILTLLITLNSCMVITNVKYFPKQEQEQVASKESCVEELLTIKERGLPPKPIITVEQHIDETLLLSLKDHRDFINEIFIVIDSCKDK